MSLPVRYISINGMQYPVAFSTRAIKALERESGLEFARFGFLLQNGRGGVTAMVQLLWAAICGGRWRVRDLSPPPSVDDVCDLVDLVPGGAAEVFREEDDGIERELKGGKRVAKLDDDGKPVISRPVVTIHPIMLEVMEAFRDCFPKTREEDTPRPPLAASTPSPGTNS